MTSPFAGGRTESPARRNRKGPAGSKRALLAAIILLSSAASVWVASAELHGDMHWDESHSLRNVRAALVRGELRPTHAWYPALSHLPQVALLEGSRALHRLSGREIFAVLTPRGTFTPTAYLLCRLTSVAYAAAALVLAFAAARRLFGSEVALVATFLLATSPLFLYSASIYKPDMLVVALGLGALLAAVVALRRGGLPVYCAAGAAIGAASAAKQIGAFTSIPLVVATAVAGRDRRRWIGLVVAALTSGLVFLVFNPYLGLLPEYLAMGRRYAEWAAQAGVREPLWVFLLRLPLAWDWHGTVAGAAAWLGLVALAWRALRHESRRERVAGALVTLSVALYPLACAVVSTYPKSNAFVPLLPLTAMAAAWLLVESWRALARRSALSSRPAALWLVTAALVAVQIAPYGSYVHWRAVPETTAAAASRAIAADAGNLAHRVVAREAAVGVLAVGYVRFQRGDMTAVEVAAERLFQIPAAELDLADYEVFLHGESGGAHADFYRARVARVGADRSWVIEPRLLRRRGEAVTVVAHPWRRAADVEEVSWRAGADGALRARIPARFRGGDVLSIDLAVANEDAERCTLRVGGRPVELSVYRVGARASRFMTRRFRLARSSRAIRLDCEGRDPGDRHPDLGIALWRPGAATAR